MPLLGILRSYVEVPLILIIYIWHVGTNLLLNTGQFSLKYRTLRNDSNWKLKSERSLSF